MEPSETFISELAGDLGIEKTWKSGIESHPPTHQNIYAGSRHFKKVVPRYDEANKLEGDNLALMSSSLDSSPSRSLIQSLKSIEGV